MIAMVMPAPFVIAWAASTFASRHYYAADGRFLQVPLLRKTPFRARGRISSGCANSTSARLRSSLAISKTFDRAFRRRDEPGVGGVGHRLLDFEARGLQADREAFVGIGVVSELTNRFSV